MDSAASGRTNDAFDEKGCIVSRPEDFSAAKVCIGFGEREGVCDNPAGGPPRDNPIWCGECDTARIEHLSAQFELLGARYRIRMADDCEREVSA